jgi:phosphoribosylformylglycinamidine synthase
MSGSYITETDRIDVPPTLISFAVGHGDSDRVVSPDFKRSGHDLVLVEIPRDENNLPNWEEAKNNFDTIYKLVQEDRVYSAHSLGEHGLISSIVQCFGNQVGAHLEETVDIYAPRIGDILIEVSSGNSIGFGKVVGRTISEETFIRGSESIDLSKAIEIWSEPLSDIFPLEETTKAEPLDFKTRDIIISKSKVASPRVFIPVFPGTNCEYDSSRIFEKAGAIPEMVIMQNRTASHIEQSIEKMIQTIDNSQIIMFPGGFSASDEPDGSAKYIATLLRNPRMADAITRLLNERDGLILGICNGFQALVKSGLLPYGEIRETTPESPTLTYNTIGRHISKMATTRIASNLSPWLAHMRVGEEFVIPISHGEGRFVAPESVLTELKTHGQIATQYLETPNGSDLGIEGITSLDGRIFGKMGHSERFGPNVSKNIPGNKEQNIFKNGVDYYA